MYRDEDLGENELNEDIRKSKCFNPCTSQYHTMPCPMACSMMQQPYTTAGQCPMCGKPMKWRDDDDEDDDDFDLEDDRVKYKKPKYHHNYKPYYPPYYKPYPPYYPPYYKPYPPYYKPYPPYKPWWVKREFEE